MTAAGLMQVPLWLPPSPPQGGRRSKARRSLSLPLVGRVGEGRSLPRPAWRKDTPLCPAGHLPLKGGDRQEAPARPISAVSYVFATPERDCEGGQTRRRDSISPLEGEMAGRPEGGAIGARPLFRHPGLEPGSSHAMSIAREDSSADGSFSPRTRAGWRPDQVRHDGENERAQTSKARAAP